jgi:DNA-binding NarL/FixJ family response regulator
MMTDAVRDRLLAEPAPARGAGDGAASAGEGSKGERRVAPSILVVEDEPLVATYIRDVLAESGFTISGVASSGSEAMSLAMVEQPDLALVDIRLAGPMDGIEVATMLRSRYRVPTIFLSGTDDPEILRRAHQARPLGFLQKPFRPSQVFNAIQRALDAMPRD